MQCTCDSLACLVVMADEVDVTRSKDQDDQLLSWLGSILQGRVSCQGKARLPRSVLSLALEEEATTRCHFISLVIQHGW